MPTYQYACTECDHAFEQFQSFSDDALTVCPQCSGRLRKVFNAVGVVFKGSGFYRTDSRATKDDSAPAATEKSAGDTSPDKSAAKGSDTGSNGAAAAAGGGRSESSGDKSKPSRSTPTSSSTAGGTGSSSAA